nr:LPS assembly protein LptD [Methylomarinum sp. Ch1-1]MDP4519883.1 LPS assembly protein LptD [Methylomarinum sp. Ch1-1]
MPVPQPLAESEPAAEKARPVFMKPPRTVAKRPGWTCSANEQDETWNCSLIGADPKGRARVVEHAEHDAGLLDPAYDFSEEEIFKALQAQLPYDPWQNCLGPSVSQPALVGDKDLRNTAPMDVHADYSEVFDKEITSFFGNVDITRADQHVQADMASYDTVSETMDAQGHVFYSENEISLYSETALLNLATDEARLREALFISPSGPIRGSADVVYRDSKVLSRYTEASFTSCRPGNQDWVVHADRLKMNRATGQASAKHAWLEFKGLPVLYTPYISFPLDDRRLSGILPPSFGSTEKNGFDLEVPYYWNIAPNYDATITPRYMTKRGGMLRTQFRYLTEISRGNIGLEYMPYDSLREESRYSASVQAQSNFGYGVSSNLDLNYVSDDDYFNDLNNALGFSDTRHVRSLADLRYNQSWMSFVARLENYQTIDRSIPPGARPYQKYPQLQLNLHHEMDDFPLNLAMENQYTYFYRSGRVSGQRLNLKPSISFPWQTAGAFFTPKFSLQHTQYALEDQLPGRAEDISRTLPIVSVDGGLFFERDFDFGDSSYLHTLEPRAFYLYIPHEDQSDIPLFDTSLYDLNFFSLFRDNRFNGPDRVQDANQVTLALTSRLIDSDSGRERLKLSVGEIFYFRDREVLLRGNTPETNSLSNLIAELSGQLTDHLSFSSSVQWNPDVNDITRGQGTIRYRNQPEQIINLGYRYRRDNPNLEATIIQSDMSFRWPLYDNWFAVGRWQYSLKFNQTVESFLGLEKESCCWRFRVIGRRFVNNISNSEEAKAENGVFVQLELKGLASFGDKVDNFLEKNLYGYRKPEN